MQVALLAPSPGLSIQCRQGSVYTADTNGIIRANVQQWDLIDLYNAGCVPAEETMLFQSVSGGTHPAAIGSDIVVAVATLPANFFYESGIGVEMLMLGSFANNTNTKTAKIIFNPSTAVVGSAVGSGGTTISTTGAYSTTGLVGFTIGAQVSKYGALGSNTQFYVETEVIIGATHSGMGVPTAMTATESSSILIAFTLDAATQVSDASLFYASVQELG